MSDVADGLRRLVVNRAGNRCEYCRLSQEGQEAIFPIDHITPSARGGAAEPDHLTLACVSLSPAKIDVTDKIEHPFILIGRS